LPDYGLFTADLASVWLIFFKIHDSNKIPGNSRRKFRVARFPGIPEWENPVALPEFHPLHAAPYVSSGSPLITKLKDHHLFKNTSPDSVNILQ